MYFLLYKLQFKTQMIINLNFRFSLTFELLSFIRLFFAAFALFFLRQNRK